jgi:hypothetical protein
VNPLAHSLILIVLFASCAFPQRQPASTLVDSLQNPSCEDLWARLDYFLVELSKKPDSSATIALSGKMSELRDDLWIEDMIRVYFRSMKNVPTDRWRIVRTGPAAARKIELWITPPGGKPPEIQQANWSLLYAKTTKPFIFAYSPDHMEDVTVCLPSNQLRLLAQVLSVNPTARTNVVLVVRSQKEYARRMRQTIAELVDDYGVQRRHIKIFKKVTRKKDPYNIEPDVEYWFVP